MSSDEEEYLISRDSIERRKHYAHTTRFLAQHRDTTYKDIPIHQLIPLAFYAKISHLKKIDDIISIVSKSYDASHFFSDWQKYCKVLKSKQRAIAVLEGGLFIAGQHISSLENRRTWTSTCLSSFRSLLQTTMNGEHEHNHQAEEGASSNILVRPLGETSGFPPQSLHGVLGDSVPQTQASVSSEQGVGIGAFQNHSDMLPSEYTMFPTLQITTTRDIFGDFIYDDILKTMHVSNPSQIYLPSEVNGDWILEVWLSRPAGQTIIEAKDGTHDHLKAVLGVFLFAAVITSKLIKEQPRSVVAVHATNDSFCGLYVTISFDIGMYLMKTQII